MNYLLYELLPMILFMTLGQLAYLKFDKKYMLTNMISLKLKISQQWKPFACFCCLMTTIIIISILEVLITKTFKINILDILSYILNGFVIGVGIGIMNKIGTIKDM